MIRDYKVWQREFDMDVIVLSVTIDTRNCRGSSHSLIDGQVRSLPFIFALCQF
jgi:hypothetical protein